MHILPPVTAEEYDGSHHHRYVECILGSKKSVHFVLGDFPLPIMSTYLVPKSRSEHVHYNRDFKL